ncbi:MAG TPA: fused MFS/spermidine synthase, partial [Burkholderiales bacterium]|nr:fused MFS/spermidine synthase [Burkholderiales bacterium]
LLFVDGTTLIFAVMLATVLTGIGLGGLAAARLAPSLESLARAAAAGAAALVVGSYAAFGALVKLLSPLQPGSVASAALLCAFLMAPVALLSGFLFTALGARLRARMHDAGAATGALTLANTLGATLGSLLAAFVLLAYLGMERSFLLLALLYGLIVLVIPAHEGARWRGLRPALAAGVALALFPFGAMTGTHYRDVEARHGARIVAAREGLSQTTFYLRHDFLGEPLFHRLVTNSYSMASTAVGVQRYMKLFAWLPAALHPKIESALVLCFGVGATASAVAALPEVKAIDVVDTSRDILEMSEVVFPDAATHPLRDPRVSVHVEDARLFLQLAARRYDLVTGEPPPPKMAGVASLYTREYFALMKSRLNPGGLATYWLPAYLVLENEALSIVRAFCDAFEDCSLWSGLNRDWILLGSNGGLAPVRREHFARLWGVEAIGGELRRLGIDGPAQLAGQFMADAAALREATEGIAPLVDDHPRRIRPALQAEASTPAYTFLMDAERGRERLAASGWAAEIAAGSREGFRRRGILDAAFQPELRRADYSFWADVADLIRGTDLVELPRWLLGSGARVAQIAARRGADDPLAAQHLAIDALANRRRPEVMEKDRFMALPPWGQTVTVFHHCLAGERERARAMMQWMRERGPSFVAWAARECGLGAP